MRDQIESVSRERVNINAAPGCIFISQAIQIPFTEIPTEVPLEILSQTRNRRELVIWWELEMVGQRN